MPDHLEEWAKRSDLDSYCNGIVPLMTPDGLFTGQAKVAYEFRWKKDDLLGAKSLIDAYKMLIDTLAQSIRELQRADREPSPIWTQERTNADQIECVDGCPFGYDKQGIGTHYHDLMQYQLEEV